MKIVENIPDSVKVLGSVSPPALTFFGIAVQEWTYVLSALISIMFIIEKIPTMYRTFKRLYIKLRAKLNALRK